MVQRATCAESYEKSLHAEAVGGSRYSECGVWVDEAGEGG